MEDFEGLRQEFDKALAEGHDRNELLFCPDDHSFKTTEDLASHILIHPRGLISYVNWFVFIPTAKHYGFSFTWEDLAVFNFNSNTRSLGHFNSPLCRVLFRLANHSPEDFSLEQFL